MAEGYHLYPYRTQKLSPPALMVLGWQRPGRVGRCRINVYDERSVDFTIDSAFVLFYMYFILLYSSTISLFGLSFYLLLDYILSLG